MNSNTFSIKKSKVFRSSCSTDGGGVAVLFSQNFEFTENLF